MWTSSFVGFTIAVRTEVVVGGGVIVVVVEGSAGFGCDVNVTFASLVIVPLAEGSDLDLKCDSCSLTSRNCT